MRVYEGAHVQSPTKLTGTVIAIDNSIGSVVIEKDTGGVFSCPIDSVTVIKEDK